jgi:hypothetical protein
LNLPFVKTLRIKEAKIKILNMDKTSNSMTNSVFTEDSISSFASNSMSNNFFNKSKSFSMQPNKGGNTPLTTKRINHFQFNNSSTSGNNFTSSQQHNSQNKTVSENFTIENEFSSVDSVKDVTPKKANERIGSFRIKNSNGTSLYFIKKNSNNHASMNSSFNTAYDDLDDNDDINTTITDEKRKQDMKVDLPRKSSILRKSQVFNLVLYFKKTNNFKNKIIILFLLSHF